MHLLSIIKNEEERMDVENYALGELYTKFKNNKNCDKKHPTTDLGLME